jgi:predicted GNAT superfamily acetyltransferase
MRALGEWARAGGAARLALAVYADNVGARGRHARLGFTETGEEPARDGRTRLAHLSRAL